MALEDMEKKYRISDIARELQVSPQEVLLFVKQEGGRVASTSSMVGEEIHGLIFGHFSVEKKMVDETKKIRAEKEKRLSRLEEQSRKTYEKEQHLSETLSPPAPPLVVVHEPKKEVIVAAPIENIPEPPSKPLEIPVAETPASEEPDAPPAVTELIEQPVVIEQQPLAPVSDAPVPPVIIELPVPSEVPESQVLPESRVLPESQVLSESPLLPEPPVLSEPQEQQELPELPELPEIPALPEPAPKKEEPSVNEHLVSFDAPQMMGGLTVLGTLDMQAGRHKKNRKKNFQEQADALKDEFEPKPAEESRVEEKVVVAKKPPVKAAADVKPKPVVADSSSSAKKKGKKKKKPAVDDKVISANIQKTISGIDDRSSTGSRQKFRKMRRNEREREHEEDEAFREAQRLVVRVTEYASPHELAELMGITAKDIIQKCFALGKFVTINQRLDKESIELIALEFGFEAEFISEVEATAVIVTEDAEADMQTRPPVVTIMGHVDHGKTSLLDYIRNSKVVAGESGGITQHIGAYEVTVEGDRKITFLDTPGHEAFTAMRARGAQVTDIVILVVAADDSVMPQTIEAINHAKAAGVPIVVALNKIDKVEANPEKIKTQLSEAGVLVEEWGGVYQCQEISAKKGIGIAELMEKVLTEAEMRELRGNYSREVPASGIIVESELDKGKGVISTVLVQRGILKVGDPFVAGNTMGKVRALMDERGKRIPFANPSQPVRVLGFEDLPQSGDALTVMVTDREARDLAQKRQVIRREHDFRRSTRVKLDSIARQIKEGLMKELSVIIKADTDGSIQALADGLMKIQNEEVKVQIIHQGVGQITETDVLLAAASDAIIIGFRVRPNVNAKKLAEKEDLDVRFYSVIYHVLEDVEKALEGMLSPELHEESLGSLEIRQIFKVPKIGNVGGCYMLEGKMFRDSKVRLLRDGVQIYEGQLAALKRFKDDVKEVDAGYECGMSLKNYDDIKVGDIVEAYKIVEKKRKL
ncbi:translation initiation factor IF-2 [Pelodictyon phaeoclathratiforme]|jgi:translation initiation factor IF-2|uniref:Translation initiation factor IF-2 n=1 Tax=Pelodictyon phaeoclathratiforme (strain DSM 5477 / BU-1) TaxID=324925 RepID=IF2_PELPB|nr:translation initiation factor IF-2 [Pelodictyon phaeoclathratiforme]B4SCE7.1 RecName: Full=Translation initiation factor IF-2 [Pelodictyon phaeoclathratiforme BU-1]ACF42727.1 translation initiation factor IF-2 [Pelodictyon phaeoclathratiforme BU-1]MBV5288500.1 translation initiation factor IF-2 [Pelodictyon phaeoclathratiforme]